MRMCEGVRSRCAGALGVLCWGRCTSLTGRSWKLCSSGATGEGWRAVCLRCRFVLRVPARALCKSPQLLMSGCRFRCVYFFCVHVGALQAALRLLFNLSFDSLVCRAMSSMPIVSGLVSRSWALAGGGGLGWVGGRQSVRGLPSRVLAEVIRPLPTPPPPSTAATNPPRRIGLLCGAPGLCCSLSTCYLPAACLLAARWRL